MRISKIAKVASLALAFGLVAGTPAHAVDLTGSGATFPAGIIDACKAGFSSASGHSYTYGQGGSGKGRGDSDKSVGDFWFSDSAYTAATKRPSLINIPVVAAPIAILHNLPAKTTLQLSGATIAGIFSGKITKWNDPAIAADNNRSTTKVIYRLDKNGNPKKDAKGDPIILRTQIVQGRYTLPNKDIKVVYRSDSSGTSDNFTNYLNKTVPSVWTNAKNGTFSTSFPGGAAAINGIGNLGRFTSASGSSAVALQASKTPYSITYAEVGFAKAVNLKVANLINPAGSSVVPDAAGTAAFLSQGAIDSIGNVTFDYATKEKGAYTLGIVSYMIADTSYPSAATGKAVKEFASYLLSTKCAKDVGAPLGFAVLDGDFLKKATALIARIG